MFRQLVNVAPGSAEAWRGLAVTANKLGERADAERGMRRYLQLRPHTKDPGRILQSLAPVY
jgi:Flp pilus assembly protein TadD